MSDQQDLAVPDYVPQSALEIIGQRRAVYYSVPDTVPHAKQTFIRALNNCTGKVSAMLDKPIVVQDLLVHRVETVSDDDGQVIELTRVVLITPDGETYESTSKGVANAISAVHAMYRKPPWNPPLKMTFTERKLASPKRVFVLADVSQVQENRKR